MGHFMAFQLCRCLLKQVSIMIYLYIQYHLSTFCLKCISTCIWDFTLLVIFFYDVVYGKTVPSSESFYEPPMVICWA